MNKLMKVAAAIAVGISLCGCSASVSDIQDAVLDSMHEKGLDAKEVTLSKVGENRYHGMVKDGDGDFHTVDVTVADDSVMWKIK